MTAAPGPSRECPFFRASRSLSRELMAFGIYTECTALGIYCQLPSGRVRVPSGDEVKQHCVPNRFEACPIYGRHAR
jgi:hypothetical protein